MYLRLTVRLSEHPDTTNWLFQSLNPIILHSQTNAILVSASSRRIAAVADIIRKCCKRAANSLSVSIHWT